MTIMITYITLNLIFGVLTLVGNSLILLAVYKTPSLRNPSNYLLCSLATADIVVGLFVNTNNAILHGFHLWHSNHVLRHTEQVFYVQTIAATSMSLCAVSIDRYIAIKQPLRYVAIMTNQKCLRIISLIWVVSVVFGLPAGLMEGTDLFRLWAVALILGFFVPFIVIVFCYVEIMRIANSQQKRIAAELRLRNSFQRRNFRQETISRLRGKQAAVTFALITVIFLVTFAPDLINSILHVVRGHTKGKHGEFELLTLWLTFLLYTSSATNPIVYGFRSREFRAAMRKILTCSKPSRDTVSRQNTNVTHS